MTYMTAERRSGFPWWGWLLVLIGAGLTIWGLAEWSTTTGAAARARYVPGAGFMPSNNQPVESLRALYHPVDVNAVIGRAVHISGARVTSVVNNGLFWVGEPGGRQVLVDARQVNPSQPRWRATPNVAAGDAVNVAGHVAPMLNWQQAKSLWNVNDSLRPSLETHRVYILASGVDVNQNQRLPEER